ncbi:MAG: tetratricopeptide repeat protein [Spirochaetales bacterium]|jgi:Ca-activated chloride channel family protein|nr:tetratricopeptide repeat protein [Spirochaetales bacterium]
MYQAAIVSYMRALDAYGEGGGRAWVEYNLGCAYYSLGEASSALSVWERAGLSEDRELLFHVAYNKGCLFSELGRYREACGEFRQALRLDPGAVDAKVNLELALRKLSSGAGGAPRQGPGSGPYEEAAGDEAGRILDYVKRKDATKWVAADELAGSAGDDW